MKRQSILAVTVLCFLCLPALGLPIEIKDGGVHYISFAVPENILVDYQTPGVQTTINFLNGGSMPYNSLYAYEDSIINMSGGEIDDLVAHNRSLVEVISGEIHTALAVYDRGKITFSGGSTGYLRGFDSSEVIVSGGEIGGQLGTYNSSQLTVSGGLIGEHLVVNQDGQVSLSGGSIGGNLLLYKFAVLTIYGSDFAINGTPVDYGEYFASDYLSGTLTGTLASGDTLNNVFSIEDNASIVLVPEPATLLLLGLGTLFFRKTGRAFIS